MKLELIVIGITAFLIINTYKDGKYTNIFTKYQKYYKMGLFGFVGFAFYLFMKKNPGESKNMMIHASNMIKYMPVDRNTSNMLAPILDFTNGKFNFSGGGVGGNMGGMPAHNFKRMMNSGRQAHSRSVSESKKKFIAAQQEWKCKGCNQTLQASFEVDHIVPLHKGGNNHVNNLRALCRNCHGNVTLMDNF